MSGLGKLCVPHLAVVCIRTTQGTKNVPPLFQTFSSRFRWVKDLNYIYICIRVIPPFPHGGIDLGSAMGLHWKIEPTSTGFVLFWLALDRLAFIVETLSRFCFRSVTSVYCFLASGYFYNKHKIKKPMLQANESCVKHVTKPHIFVLHQGFHH